jgi:SAM dependent carboxyl methyltransferase
MGSIPTQMNYAGCAPRRRIVPQDPSFFTPSPMEGQGGYNRSSQVQAAGLSPAVPMLELAARTVALTAGSQPIVIADYGSSEGHNSLLPLGAAIAILRQRIGADRPISVVHTDVPENDFSVLFETLNTDPNSYLLRDQAVFASAVGRSFYEQILPAGSVTLAWSSWAVQWLSRAPGPIPDQVQAAFSRDASARAAFSRQAAEDWQRFLTHRERELCPGGRLAVMTMAVDENGEFGYRPLLNAMYTALVDMVDDGFLSGEELRRMVIPTVARSRADFLAPFGAEGRLGSLRLEELDIFLGEDHFWLDFERDGDAQKFAARWAAFSRASVFPSLASGLEGGGHDARGAQFVAGLESGTTKKLAADPEPMLIPLAKLLLAKGA